MQIARASLSTSAVETREQAIEGDGKNPSLGQPVLSSDDRGVQADLVTSTHLGVGGTDDEHVVVERTAIDEPDEITDAVRRYGMGTCGDSFFFCAKHSESTFRTSVSPGLFTSDLSLPTGEPVRMFVAVRGVGSSNLCVSN